MNTKIKTILGFLLVTILGIGCGTYNDDFYSSGRNPATGNLQRNGQQGLLFVTTASADLSNNQTVTIRLSNVLRSQNRNNLSGELIQALNFTVPTNQLGQSISVSATTASFNEFVPTITIPNPPSARFESVQATGTITLFSFFDAPGLLDPDSAQGIFDVTFTDAQGNTRQITNGFIGF